MGCFVWGVIFRHGVGHDLIIIIEQWFYWFDFRVARDAVAYVKRELRTRGPTIVERLLSPRYLPAFSTARDLATFLRMHPDLFEIHASLVSLVPCDRDDDDDTVGNNGGPTSENKRPGRSSASVKDRVNSVLMKTLSENAGRDRAQQHLVSTTTGLLVLQPGGSDNPTDPNAAKALRSVHVVTGVKESRAIVSAVTQQRLCGVDVLGVNTGPEGAATLITLGTSDGKIHVIDVMVSPELVGEGHLKQLLEDEGVVKAAHAALEHQETGKPLHKVKNVGLAAVCEIYGSPITPVRSGGKREATSSNKAVTGSSRRDQRYWARRPLTDDMLTCAAFDVLALVPHLHDAMQARLTPGTRALLRDLCAEQVGHFIARDDVRQRKKARKLGVELAELRDKLATASPGKTMFLSNREIRLLRHMDLTDEEKEKLEGSEKVQKKLDRIQGGGRNDRISSEASISRQNLDSLGAGSDTADFPSLDSAFTDSHTSPDSSLASSTGDSRIEPVFCLIFRARAAAGGGGAGPRDADVSDCSVLK
ncbi:unnamed protein product [Notodromas monacha]|uniref:3'-5' exonuclease domain-containing protein n=1 Tax=Notodromas monacha TaxID=399045 RepID=A0A7R9BKQ4_9CRUS|nr:unnamed protein product [Notodromas monacha]CAG0917275.1 unnamed protein product [Notodromas monacha]